MAFRGSTSFKTIFRYSLDSSIITQKISYKFLSSLPSSSSSSSLAIKQTFSTERLFHKDWLSPNEVVKIFGTAEPNSVLSLLDHVSKRKDFKPNEALYSVIITKLGEARNFAAIDDMLEIIKTQKNCTLSDCFFYNVIKIYGNGGGLVDRVIETLLNMPSFECWPSVKTFNYVLNLLVSSRRFDAVHRVYLGAAQLLVKVDACTLNILIKGLCKRGCLKDALQVLDEFPKQGCSPNKLTFSTIMHCMCEKGMLDEAFGLVDRMEKQGVSPDAVIFNVLVSGWQKQGRVDEAMELLDRMRLKGCEPNKGTYQEVLYGLLNSKRFIDARDFVHQMRSNSLIPSFFSYKLLILGLCGENLLGEVDWVLKSMVSVGFVPRTGMWRNILQKMFSRQHPSNIELVSEIVKDLHMLN